MKKLLFILTFIATAFIFVSCSDDDDNEQRISLTETHEGVQTFLKKHFIDFSEADIDYIELEKSSGVYDVKFKNRIEIDFYPNGVWKEIDLNGNSLPNSIAMLLPESALNYIHSTYPNAIIEEIEKLGNYSEDGQNFKIELRNDRDIIFDASGKVLKDKGETSKDKEENIAFNDLKPISQEFLNTYFKGQTPSLIEKEWNTYEVIYNKDKANEIEVEFFATDGSFKSVESDQNQDLIRSIIEGIGSKTILEYLDQNHRGQIIEEFSVAASGITISNGYVVEVDAKPDYKIYFDQNGKYLQSVRD